MTLRYFTDKNISTADRALQLWQILIGYATNRQTTTYNLLAQQAKMVTVDGKLKTMALWHALDRIMKYCEKHKLPPLTILVVNQEKGQPGQGLTTSTNRDADRERVFAYPWFLLLPPTVEDLSPSPHISIKEEVS